MGIGAIDYAINGGIAPKRIVVVDIDDARLAQAQKLLPVELAASKGIELSYINTSALENPQQTLRELTGGHGFDDVFVYAAVPSVIELAKISNLSRTETMRACSERDFPASFG